MKHILKVPGKPQSVHRRQKILQEAPRCILLRRSRQIRLPLRRLRIHSFVHIHTNKTRMAVAAFHGLASPLLVPLLSHGITSSHFSTVIAGLPGPSSPRMP